jgi:hypothetical protein
VETYRVGLLGGYNKGKAQKEEEREKREMERKGSTSLFRGYKVLSRMSSSGRTVLEHTIDALLDSRLVDLNHSMVIGGKQEIYDEIGELPIRVLEQENSLYDNIMKLTRELYADGYVGNSVITCADLPAMRAEDLDDFIIQSRAAGVDFVVGMGNLKELEAFTNAHENLKEYNQFNKKSIPFRDDSLSMNYLITDLHFGNSFFFTKNVYDHLDELGPKLEPLLGMKKLFRKPENLRRLAMYLKDDNVPRSKLPRERYPILDALANMENKDGKETKLAVASSYLRGGLQTIATISFGMKHSEFMKKLLKSHFKKDPMLDEFVSTSELEKLVQERIISDSVSFKMVEVHPRIISDNDDNEIDMPRNDIIIKNNY